jgi:deoxyribodipyrimidine photo-lyase
MPGIVWFRRDLRLHDHPALHAALEAHDEVVPVFVLDEKLLAVSPARTAFLLDRLRELDAALMKRGGRLVIRSGPAERELQRLGDELGTDDVYVTKDVTPYARARGRRVREAGLRLHGHPGLLVVDEPPGPYKVFTPFFRKWQELPRRPLLDAPESVPVPAGIRSEDLPEVGQVLPDPRPRLSAHLHLGSVSPLEAERQVDPRKLAWRDFYHQVLMHHPDNTRLEMQESKRGLVWVDDDESFDAWREGQTGFPLVDAAMRQLRHEGFIHNRMRLLVASFLVKDLGIDWRRGEAWFMRCLLDGDVANNNGNWQWVASVGTDPAPWWRRHYSPDRHRERYDPDWEYVQRWVPEWGTADYPEPIIDRRSARAEAAERYQGRGRSTPPLRTPLGQVRMPS